MDAHTHPGHEANWIVHKIGVTLLSFILVPPVRVSHEITDEPVSYWLCSLVSYIEWTGTNMYLLSDSPLVTGSRVADDPARRSPRADPILKPIVRLIICACILHHASRHAVHCIIPHGASEEVPASKFPSSAKLAQAPAIHRASRTVERSMGRPSPLKSILCEQRRVAIDLLAFRW